MEKIKKTKTVRKTRAPKSLSGKFYTANVNITDNSMLVSLPANIADYLGITNNNSEKVYWTAINGIVQISGIEPNVAIPMIGINAESFVAQE